MAGNFDLAAAISGMVSRSDTNAPEVRMIPIVDIIPNPKNFYKIDKEALKPLMDSIAMDGSLLLMLADQILHRCRREEIFLAQSEYPTFFS